MQKLHLVGFTTDRRGLIFSARRGAKSGGFVVHVDEAVHGAIEEAWTQLSAGVTEAPPPDELNQPRPESALSVREVQARLRAGRSIDEVAREARMESAWVLRFAAPIVAEQAQMVAAVRAAVFERARSGPSALPLGEAVYRNLAEKGVTATGDELDENWSARQLADGLWLVTFRYQSRGRSNHASWEYDERADAVRARDRLATQLAYREPRGGVASPAARGGGGGAARRSPAPPKRRVSSARKLAANRMAAAVKKSAARDATAARKAAEAKTEAARRAEAEVEKAAAKKAADRAKVLRDRERARAAAKKAAEREKARRQREKETAAREAAAARAGAAAARAAAKKATRPMSPPPAKKAPAPKKAAAKKARPAKPTPAKTAAKKPAAKKQTTLKKRSAVKKAPALRASVTRATSAGGRRRPVRVRPTDPGGSVTAAPRMSDEEVLDALLEHAAGGPTTASAEARPRFRADLARPASQPSDTAPPKDNGQHGAAVERPRAVAVPATVDGARPRRRRALRGR